MCLDVCIYGYMYSKAYYSSVEFCCVFCQFYIDNNFFLRRCVLLQKQVTVPLSSVEFRHVFASFT